MVMALYTDKIEAVRAFEVPAGIWADGDFFEAARLVLVQWRSGWAGKFYQVYVNGRYAGSTTWPEQRQMMVQLPNSFKTAARIEVFAVEEEDVDGDFSSELDSSRGESGRVKIGFLRGQDLPVGSKVQIYFDNGTGQIDYDNPINEQPVSIWPCRQDKMGFGLSCFGKSDFGYDGAAAVGFGKGCFGRSEFGFDADEFFWVSRQLNTGVYKFAVKVVDTAGNESSIEQREIKVIAAAGPAEDLDMSSFDKVTNQLVLSVS